jgi:hypothetical protein
LSRYGGDGADIVVVFVRRENRVLVVLAGEWREHFAGELQAYPLVELNKVCVPSADVDVFVAGLFDSDEIFLRIVLARVVL